MLGNHQVVIGQVRVQALSESLVRLEVRGKVGFEDRNTFTVVDREWEGIDLQVDEQPGWVTLSSAHYQVFLPERAPSLDGVRVESTHGEILYKYEGGLPPISYLPEPGDKFSAWVMADHPRIVPPPWGATPPLGSAADSPTSGWDMENDAPDIYIFIPGKTGYRGFVRDFLKLTGPIPIPPLYNFGLFDSRYHPYDENSALQTIDTYRNKGIPLDVFVMDTDWRVGASHGYTINENLFPDMAGFIDEVHRRGVYLMYNDHPEPKAPGGLNPAELSYRYESLTSLLKFGADMWWYDRNWMTHIETPVDGLPRDVWGQRLYHDITRRFRPERRPMIMSNVAGIEHGKRIFPTHPAEHRFPIWWTGDTYALWDYLRLGIENGVDYGIIGLMPYVNEDLGGHIGDPGNELYVRFVQFGVFSPITRLHCTKDDIRYPWAFGEEVEGIVREYIRLRYRLLPTIYAAAHCAYEDGTPLLRRNDLYWPSYPQAADSRQYLFGEDMLVAPVDSGQSDFAVLNEINLSAEDGKPGLTGEYYPNADFSGDASYTQVDSAISFSWGFGRAPEGLTGSAFSIRWRGQLENIMETGEYTLGLYYDGVTRLWLDGDFIHDQENDNPLNPVFIPLELEKNCSYDLRLEYITKDGWSAIWLTWLIPSKVQNTPTRGVWLPPGGWIDVWNGKRMVGPTQIQVSSELWHTPLYIREGGVIFSLPQLFYTGEKPWSQVIIDAYLPKENGRSIRTLYEDDGITEAYQDGAFCLTPITLEREGNKCMLRIDRISGEYQGRLEERSWVIRLHLPKGDHPQVVNLDGVALSIREDLSEDDGLYALLIKPGLSVKEMPFKGIGSTPGPNGGPVLEVVLAARRTDQRVVFEVIF